METLVCQREKRYDFPFALLQKFRWRLFDRQPVWAEKRAGMVTATKTDVSAGSRHNSQQV